MIRRWLWNAYARVVAPHLTFRVHRFDNGDVSVGVFFDRQCKWCLNGMVLRGREKQRVETLLVYHVSKHHFQR